MNTPRLTANQRDQLLALIQAMAVAEATAVSVDDLREHGRLASPLVIGKLRDLGLAQSRVVHRRRSQHTAYWLTLEGVKRARQLQDAGHA